MSYNLEIIMREAAERFVEICYSANLDPQKLSFDALPIKVRIQLEEVIQWLRDAVEDCFLTLAIYDHEDNKDKILPFILGGNEIVFSERLEDYCGKYRNELLLLIGAGLFLGIGKMALAKTIGSHLKQPYRNPDLAEGIAAPITYGRGHTNSMFTAINALTRYGIGKAWMYNRHLEAAKKEAYSFMTFRNSSVPCDICDDYASYMHPMDDPIPPLHGSCVCGTIYFNYEGIPV